MNNWISVNTKLPKIGVPVLCVLKSACPCDHYVPAILARVVVAHDGHWEWITNVNTSNDIEIKCSKELVKCWQSLPKFPVKFNEGFER